MKTKLSISLTSFGVAFFLGTVFVKTVAGQTVPIVSMNPITQYAFNEQHGDGMVGWIFNLQRTITIDQVGWYDDGQDGLSRAFQVGLWQDLNGTNTDNGFQGTDPNSIIGDPVNGLTIPRGTSASLNGAYRVVNLSSPLTLAPGNYELGGLDTAGATDPIRFMGNYYQPYCIAGMSEGPFFCAWGGPDTTTHLQVTHDVYLADGLELGPMLFATVPEPSALALAGLGAVALLASLQHRRRLL
ncbi:MAG TPA: PEP-CTERM sorting domain-containing protein [Verrucomicrobiae bacterium]|nr:PEP-CTERM sorting domain-containing protein [Verrucomicrobiae bacterium]